MVIEDSPQIVIPKAGPEVAKELERCCLPEEKWPAIWDFFDRHGKAIDQSQISFEKDEL